MPVNCQPSAGALIEMSYTKRPVIMQHCFGAIGAGGPMTGLHMLLQSELTDHYDFEVCIQDRPAGGINLPLILQMGNAIRKVKPDLLHVRGLQNEGFHGLVAGRIAGCRRILVSVHGTVGDIQYPTSRLKQMIVNKVFEPMTLYGASGIYCVCETTSKRPFISRFARRNYGYVHNAIALPDRPVDRKKIRNSFDLSQDEVVVICVARLTKEKGLRYLYQALKDLDCTIAFTFILVGDGPEIANAKHLSATLKTINLKVLGKRLDVHELLSMSDMFVLPSLHENLSNALLEAMASNLPVVATHVGGNTEVVIDGETGIVIPPKDVTALAKAIDVLVKDKALRSKMGKRGKERIKKHFSMPVMVKKLNRIYKQMLS